MKKFLTTVALCISLLGLLSYYLFPVSEAAENPLLALLNLPAPPPPNPEAPILNAEYGEDFFNRNKPPADDASIEALLAYWRQQAQEYNELRYKVYPSDKVLDRLFAEISKRPEIITGFLNIFPPDRRSAEFVKSNYERAASSGEGARDHRSTIRNWMKYNTPHFSSELARDANRVRDNEGYVVNHRELIALARVDWDKASPIVSRLYNNPGQRASRTAALWALYLHAIDNSPGDTDKYRDELKKTVEDKELPDGIRDLALDALSLEKEWSGRDEWYTKLMEDETMLELGSYTGLTTLITNSPEGKYIDRMIALLDSENINVRTAAARNLMTTPSLQPQIVKALLPWLSNRKWLKEGTQGRDGLVHSLATIKLPEAVPALIVALDEGAPEKHRYDTNAAVSRAMEAAALAANAAANAVAAAANAASAASNSASVYDGPPVNPYPLRYAAVNALANQQDPRAVSALRRILAQAEESHQQTTLVNAIYECGGFSLPEQVDAIEELARNADEFMIPDEADVVANAANASYNARPKYSLPSYTIYDRSGRPTSDVKRLLGLLLAQSLVVKDDLGQAVVDRILSLDQNDAKTAKALRMIVRRWHAPAVNVLLLHDLKRNRTDTESIVRLLGVRKKMRETQQSRVFEIRTGSQIAVGISACLLEDTNDYDAILDGASDEAKTAMLACARLIRASLPLEKVAANLTSKDRLLALAAERYLESEDSPEARRIVLSIHPGEAKILGATTAFFNEGAEIQGSPSTYLAALFASVGESVYHNPQTVYSSGDFSEIERRLQEEVKKQGDLLGVYNWEENFIHVFKEKILLSWHDDSARYRERPMTQEEFDNFRGLVAHFKADELPPFLLCTDCRPRQLLMLGRNGGRRVFVKSQSAPKFFEELDQLFRNLRRSPAVVKYWASKDVPGLEVLFADDRLDAKSVWKNGNDFRLLTADKVRRGEIDRELEEFADEAVYDDEPADVDRPPDEDEDPEYGRPDKIQKERARREYENYVWSTFSNGALAGVTTQPEEVPYVRAIDGLEVPAVEGQWKARSGTVEVRASDAGLFKVTPGKLTRIKAGYYREPVMTPNGKWVVATKYDEGVPTLVRINLATSKEFSVEPGEPNSYGAMALAPSMNRVLVGPIESEYGYEYQGEPSEETGSAYFWLDPETGITVRARGEVRPLAQQQWRPLQPTGTPFEFWAAIPEEKATLVGVYNTKNFTFKTLVTLSKITFDSSDMWVDASEGKAYIVYEGHLLAVPLKVNSKI